MTTHLRRYMPLQIHLTYVSPTEITVSWATGYGNTTQSPVDPNFFTEESGPSSSAYWGTTPGQYDYSYTANAATITRYNQVSQQRCLPLGHIAADLHSLCAAALCWCIACDAPSFSNHLWLQVLSV